MGSLLGFPAQLVCCNCTRQQAYQAICQAMCKICGRFLEPKKLSWTSLLLTVCYPRHISLWQALVFKLIALCLLSCLSL